MTTWNEDEEDASAFAGTTHEEGGHEYAAEHAQPLEELADVVWSPEQLTRLEGEWRRLQRAFAYHPVVTLIPRRGDPPHEYEVHFRVTTLAFDDAGQLDYVQQAGVHIWLPPGFPDQPPLVRPLSGIFHPNVTYEGFYLVGAWHPADTLLNLIRKIGDVLAYRIYDPESVVNPAANEWMEANAHTLPTDAAADFSPGAGGDALGRICRYGPATLDAIRQSLLDMQKSLLSFDAPEPAAVRDFAYRTRLGLNLFLENDVPDNLRSAASALDDCARELPGDLPNYDYLRGRRAAVIALRAASKAVNDALLPLGMQLDKLSEMVPDERPTDAATALRMIPEASALQPLQLAMPKLINDGDRKVVSARQQVDSITKTRVPPVIPTDTLLGQHLEKEFEKVAAELTSAQRDAREALEQFEPVLARARHDQAALERVARWREYIDMIARARALERRVAEWGSEGVQAYYIENDSGQFGPFQFEQPVDLGSGDIIVRNQSRGSVEVRVARSETVLGHSNDGKITVDIPASAGEESPMPPPLPTPGEGAGASEKDGAAQATKPKVYPTKFTLTERCDDLLVQLDFLRRQTADTLKSFEQSALESQIWCGNYCRLLSTPEAHKALDKELSKRAYRWRQAMMDLAALSPVKERLATYFLLQRVHETAPKLVQLLRESKSGLKESEKRLAEIAKHCSRDVENDRLIVPPKYSERYEKEMDYRRDTGKTVRQATSLLKSVAMQLMVRLKNPKLLGKPGIPAMRTLPPLPESLAALPLADDELGEWIVELEGLIGTPLGGPRPAVHRPESQPTEATTSADQGAAQQDTVEDFADPGAGAAREDEAAAHAHEPSGEASAVAEVPAPPEDAPAPETAHTVTEAAPAPAAEPPVPAAPAAAAAEAPAALPPHDEVSAADDEQHAADDIDEDALPFLIDDEAAGDEAEGDYAEGAWAQEDYVSFDEPVVAPPPAPGSDAAKKPRK